MQGGKPGLAPFDTLQRLYAGLIADNKNARFGALLEISNMGYQAAHGDIAAVRGPYLKPFD